MIVQCTRLINHVTGFPMDRSSWLTVGRQYAVLGISVSPRRGIQFRIMSDDGRTPGLEDSRQFEILSAAIPPGWAVIVDQDEFYLGPSEFQKQGFWEAFFDRRPEAVQLFSEVWERLRGWENATSSEPSATECLHSAPGGREKVDELLNRLVQLAASEQEVAKIHQAVAGVGLTPEELKVLGSGIRKIIREISRRGDQPPVPPTR